MGLGSRPSVSCEDFHFMFGLLTVNKRKEKNEANKQKNSLDKTKRQR